MKILVSTSVLIAGALAGTADAQFTNSAQLSPTVKGAATPSQTATTGGSFFGGGDDCAAPDAIMGQGTFSMDTSLATTGIEGQVESNCYFFGTNGIEADVWFTWTADADGTAIIDTCSGTTTFDSKLAAYPGAGCPVDFSSIACNDDTCGLQSSISFPVTNGGTYTIQVGTFPGAVGGAGELDIQIAAPPSGYSYDNGVSTGSLGLTAGGAILWAQGFNSEGGSDVITSMSSAYGSAAFPGLSAGLNATVAIWDDPTNDMDPSDAVLLWSAPATSANEDLDIFNDYAVPSVPVNGVFYAGVLCENFAGEFPAPMDNTQLSSGRAWVVGNTGGMGAFDMNVLTNNDVAPVDLDAIGFAGVWLLRVVGSGGGNGIGTPYCTAAVNSTGNGSEMSAAGSTSLAAMDVTLTATNAPANQNAIFYYGQNQTSLAFGNGNRCVGGTVFRMPPVVESGGEFSHVIDFGAQGSDLAGLGTANMQCWYRDPAAGGAFFNLSDGIEIVFVP